MLAGHFGAGLWLKARFPTVPLALILVAATLQDWLWLLMHALGWEKLRGEPVHLLRPDTFAPTPVSHDVSMTLLYAGIAGAVGMLGSSLVWSLALAIGVVSHLALDVLVHAPDIGLAGPWLGGGIGLDLWRRAPFAAWCIELAVVVAGGVAYVRAAEPPSRRRALVLTLAVALAHAATLAGP